MSPIKPPSLEQAIGISCYTTDSDGIGGRIKQQPEDFVVEEVTPEGIVLEVGKQRAMNAGNPGSFVHCTLEKKNWDTMRAVKEIARRLGVSQRRICYAGTKDKMAVTTQRISVSGKTIEDLKRISIRDLTLRDFNYADDNLGLGSLSGNRFTITIRGIKLGEEELRNRIDAISKGLASGFPNFFGVQRFGTTRPITHLVGREIVRGDFEKAVLVYLAKTFDGENEEALKARKRLSETGDFKEALKYFPKNLGYEFSMLNHLVAKPGDFRGALRVLPEGLSRMFVHAYQSYIFNKSLSEYIKKNIVVERLPLVGFESSLDEFTEKILEEENVKPEDFKVTEATSLGSKGESRECFAEVKDLKLLDIVVDELNEGSSKAVLQFSLQSGAYATTLLREYMKNEYWN